MNIWLILVTEVKHAVRNRTFLTMMILFPLVLMLILGAALSGAFNNADAGRDIRVAYLKSERSPLAQAFQYFVAQAVSQGIRFQETKSLAQGIASVQKGAADCLVRINPRGIDLYQNNRSGFRASLVRAVLRGFIQRHRMIAALARINPRAVMDIRKNDTQARAGGGNLVVARSLNGPRKPRAIDYYAVTMLTLIIMYATLTGSYAIKREILAKTANRLRCCPVRNYEILIGKMGGAICSALLHVLIVVAVSKYLFGAYWGEQPVSVALLLIAEVIMAISLGVGLAFLIRNQIALNGFLNLVIPIMVFFGGGYLPVDSFGKLFLRFAALSPLRWINKALFQVIYRADGSAVLPAVLMNLSIAAVFIAVASLAARKEAFLK